MFSIDGRKAAQFRLRSCWRSLEMTGQTLRGALAWKFDPYGTNR